MLWNIVLLTSSWLCSSYGKNELTLFDTYMQPITNIFWIYWRIQYCKKWRCCRTPMRGECWRKPTTILYWRRDYSLIVGYKSDFIIAPICRAMWELTVAEVLSQILCKRREAVQNSAKIFQGGSGVSCRRHRRSRAHPAAKVRLSAVSRKP